jgi:hypothetical protein
MVEEVIVNGNKAYLVHGSWYVQGTAPNYTHSWNKNAFLELDFTMGNCLIRISGYWADSWSAEDLIKIAESLEPY